MAAWWILFPAILIFGPIFAPIGLVIRHRPTPLRNHLLRQSAGWIRNTPPVGSGLIIGAAIGGVNMEELIREMLPFLGFQLVVVFADNVYSGLYAVYSQDNRILMQSFNTIASWINRWTTLIRETSSVLCTGRDLQKSNEEDLNGITQNKRRPGQLPNRMSMNCRTLFQRS